MKKVYNRVYQFKITLKKIKPPIWRRIQVLETYSFYDLHVAIQNVMGWNDEHLYEFHIIDSQGRIPIEIKKEVKPFRSENPFEVTIGEDWANDEDTEYKVLSSSNEKLRHFYDMQNTSAVYIYDLGDNWQHEILLENIITSTQGKDYPLCMDGERACPPENCGSYESFLEIIRNPNNKQYEETMEWLELIGPPHWIGKERKFNPEYFDPKEVRFEDPVKHRKEVSMRD